MLEWLKKKLKQRVTTRDYHFEVNNSDIIVASYPRSGNTWMRFLIAHLITDKKVVSINEIDDIVFDIYQRADHEIERGMYSEDVFKTHSFFRPKYSKCKVVYIVRDPRAVLVSYYHYQVNRWERIDSSIDEFVDRFCTTGIDHFGSWGHHVGSWMGAMKHDEKFILVKYEDMCSDTLDVVETVSDFIGLKSSLSELKRSVELSSFDRLSKEEEKLSGDSLPASSNEDERFFRKGMSDKDSQELSEVHIDKIRDSFGPIMSNLGYLNEDQTS